MQETLNDTESETRLDSVTSSHQVSHELLLLSNFLAFIKLSYVTNPKEGKNKH